MKNKYIRVYDHFGDNRISKIENDEELDAWLKDGSLDEGDEIYEVTRRLVVTKTSTLSLKEADEA